MKIFAKKLDSNSQRDLILPNSQRSSREYGAVSTSLIFAVVFVLTTIVSAVAFIWAYQQMVDYRDNSDAKVAAAVERAKTEQQAADNARFAEEQKRPYSTFTAPSIFGSVSFNFPRTWSVYVASNGADGGDLKAYFYPKQVPPVNDRTPFALRVQILNRKYTDVLNSYDGAVKSGKLSSQTITLGATSDFAGYAGTRLNGQFSDTISGAVTIFQIRDKTLLLFVDSPDFMNDFNQTVLTSLRYEQ